VQKKNGENNMRIIRLADKMIEIVIRINKNTRQIESIPQEGYTQGHGNIRNMIPDGGEGTVTNNKPVPKKITYDEPTPVRQPQRNTISI
jgi:hypothetical protein